MTITDFGLKVSQKGFDAATCADNQLLFSSSFATLKIHAQAKITISVDTAIAHNLGYVPAFWVFYETSAEVIKIDTSAQADATNLYLYAFGGSTLYYYIFRHDLTTFVTQQNINLTPGSQNVVNDYGLKISKKTFDVKTTAKKNLVIDSSSRSHIIHESGYVDSTVDNFDVTHNLGYIPMFLAFLKNDVDTKVSSLNLSGGLSGSWSDSAKIHLYNLAGFTTNWRGFYIIFKDPI